MLRVACLEGGFVPAAVVADGLLVHHIQRRPELTRQFHGVAVAYLQMPVRVHALGAEQHFRNLPFKTIQNAIFVTVMVAHRRAQSQQNPVQRAGKTGRRVADNAGRSR